MHIESSKYNHKEFFYCFERSIKDSINYLIELSKTDLILPVKFSLRWNIFAAYYLAIGEAEKGNRELCVNYLNYAVKTAHNIAEEKKLINIVALDYKIQSCFDVNMILSIVKEDDKGVTVGFKDESTVVNEKNKVQEALMLLQKVDHCSFSECCEFLDTIYLTGSTEGNYIRSGCNFNLFGLIFLYAHENNTVPYYVEHIIHESAHHALNIINAEDYIVQNDPDERFSAPFRKDKRPMIGIFHALFVLSRIAQSLSLFTAYYHGNYEEEFAERLDNAILKYRQTIKIVEEHARLTPRGIILLNGIKNVMNEIGTAHAK